MTRRNVLLLLLAVLLPSTVVGISYYYSFFREPVFYPVPPEPLDLVIGDLNADGLADVVVGSRSGRAIQILMGNGDGTLTDTQRIEPGRGVVSVAI
ncbi:MAG: VCBS repeat-containing protein, partial [Bdellovibrionales bacterium]|nr:VCBS repeat-containing protein [Bdellovibrionales bacterium]